MDLYFYTLFDKLGLAALLIFFVLGLLGFSGWVILLLTHRVIFSTKTITGLFTLLVGLLFVGYFCIYQAAYHFFSIEIDLQGHWKLRNAYGWVIKSIAPHELKTIDQKTEYVWGKSRSKHIFIEIKLPDGQKYRSHSSTPAALETLDKIKKHL